MSPLLSQLVSQILSRFDIRTIIACQLILSTVFSIVFLSLSFTYRKQQGLRSIAFAFLISVPGLLLTTLRGAISDVWSIVVANMLIMSVYIFIYRGVLQFYSSRRAPLPYTRWLAPLAVLTTTLVLAWYSLVQHNIVPRILAVSLCSGFISALIGVELLRNAAGRLSLRIFAAIMLLHTTTNIVRIILTLLYGAPGNFMQVNAIQSIAMIVNLINLTSIGIFLQTMVADEVTLAVEHSAQHDALTGTLNRHGIEQRLAHEIDRASRKSHPLSALLIDVDHFKSINDGAGHAAGDLALRTVALGISNSLRSYDLLGRYGGDEFLLLLPETAAPQALDVANRIHSLLALITHSLPTSMRPTVSIGIAEILPTDNAFTLIARADAALYDAKLAGRNCTRTRESSHSHPIVTEQHRSALRAVPSFDPNHAAQHS